MVRDPRPTAVLARCLRRGGAGRRAASFLLRVPCTGTDGGAGRVGSVVAHVSTPVFEGPFDVLLQLVSDHKVDIYEIRVSDLVDAFVAEMTRPPDPSTSRPPASSW